MGFIQNDDLWDVECDSCGEVLEVQARASSGLHNAAKSEKWKCDGEDWLCPKCQAKAKKAPQGFKQSGIKSKPYQLKRSPLKAKNAPQLARSPLKVKPVSLKKTRIKPSTTPIKKVSEKMKIKNDKYYKLRDKQLIDFPNCQFPGCFKQATDVHHVRGRGGDNRYENFKSLCRPHHDYVETHRVWAKENGLLESQHWSFETRDKKQ